MVLVGSPHFTTTKEYWLLTYVSGIEKTFQRIKRMDSVKKKIFRLFPLPAYQQTLLKTYLGNDCMRVGTGLKPRRDDFCLTFICRFLYRDGITRDDEMISVPPFFLLVKIVDKTIPPNSRFKLNSNCRLINLVYEINSTNFLKTFLNHFGDIPKLSTPELNAGLWTLNSRLWMLKL